MAGGSDGSIVFETKLATNDFNKELERIKKKFLRTQEDITTGKAKRDILTANLEKASQVLDEIRAKEKGLSVAEFEQKYAGSIQEVDKINAELDKQNKKIQDAEYLLVGLRQRYSEVKSEAEAASRTSLNPFSGFSVEEGKKSFSEFFSWIGSKIKSIPKAIMSGIGASLKAVWSLGKKAAQSILAIAKSALPLFSKSVGGVEGSFKRLIPALLSARGIIGILREAVSAYMQQNQQLSNTLSGAWTGLGNILGPVIDRIVNLTASAIAYVTKFLNLLGFTGKAAAKQMSSAGGAAKKETDKLKKQIMFFDELNILNDEKEDSGGGGGGATTAIITPEVVLPDWVKQIGEQLKSFQWSDAAKTLTDSMNRMVESADWPGIGEKAGKALDGAMTFLATAIRTFNWQNLGAKLADGINNIISNVDWENAGLLLWAKFKIILETVAGFIQNLDVNELSDAASNIAIGFLNSVTETLNTIDWQEIGNKVASFISGIDWTGISDALFGALGTALGSLAEYVWGLIEGAWNNVTAWWKEKAYDDGQFSIQGLLQGIQDALENIGTWIWEHVFFPIWNGICNAFGIHSPSTVMAEIGGYLIDGLLNGIKDMWNSIVEWFNGTIKPIFTLEYWTAMFSSIGDGLEAVFKNGINAAIGLFNKFISWINQKMNFSWGSLSLFGQEVIPSGSFQLFTIPNIPLLAQGAVIPPNAPFAAILGDQRNGTNVEAPLSTIQEAVSAVVNSQQQIDLLREQNRLLQQILERCGLTIDGQGFAKAVTDYQNRENWAMGW